jgi:hypothetical protein
VAHVLRAARTAASVATRDAAAQPGRCFQNDREISVNKIKTASALKQAVEAANHSAKFFTRANMRVNGDTMKNYGVRGPIDITTNMDEVVQAYELYRRKPVRFGLTRSAYFHATEFRLVFPKRVTFE